MKNTKSVFHEITQASQKFLKVVQEPYKSFIDHRGSFIVCKTKQEYEDYLIELDFRGILAQ